MKIILTFLLLFTATFAQIDYAKRLETAQENAKKVLIKGPSEIKILNQAVLSLPNGYAFIPKKESLELLRAMGNTPSDEVEGMIFPLKKNFNGFLVIRYINSGYIQDNDAKEWNADELLKNLQEGTKEGNPKRVEMGIPPVEVLGWITSPKYDAKTHRLIWSAKLQDIGSTNQNFGINYNTYILGREGYISMNLVTDAEHIQTNKPIAQFLLSKMDFNKGKTYSDFNKNTDKVAEYGLAALIAGVAVKKLGLLAVIAAFAVKFWKIALLGFAFLYKPILKMVQKKKQVIEEK